ncbi:uncharacterized protein LOC126379668 [Pectinophora gossypiella]|uniref:uncharacterized protein LOC126379668 n=1 Tax=Pectinophora gossypiella TaxID=13191 RepID=UPI00214F1481|nr:uncharacterized protein LOC126379668 [Pectinophora gossypiella]
MLHGMQNYPLMTKGARAKKTGILAWHEKNGQKRKETVLGRTIHNTVKTLVKTNTRDSDGGLLLNTTGCTIPDFTKSVMFIDAVNEKKRCQKRIVFVERILGDTVKFHIARHKLNGTGEFSCCYKFASRSTARGREDDDISYTKCTVFDDGYVVSLETEALVVNCIQQSNGKTTFTYEDSYLIFKMVERPKIVEKKWNVLVFGLDTMSRARAYYSLPKTVELLAEEDWLDYHGYNKVNDKSFPNLMAVLSGIQQSKLSQYKASMEKCQNSMIWTKYKEAGYVTAFAADSAHAHVINSHKNRYSKPPTDHYTKYFYHTGEYYSGNILCVQSRPGARHMFNYMGDFVEAYRNDNFFGFFWSMTYTHDDGSIPGLIDEKLTRIFRRIRRSGAYNNTFIFFFSDHGIGYGEMRLHKDAYYQDRLPMLFIWTPPTFKDNYADEFSNLMTNQYRLTTPYDLHETLLDIIKLPNSCPECKNSLFKEIPETRTCADTGMDEKWCACHNMIDARNDPAGNRTVEVMITFLRTKAKQIQTTSNCTKCTKVRLKSVLRIHSYTHHGSNYYVTAISLRPFDVAFEAVIEKAGDELKIASEIERITTYEPTAYCVVNKADKPYCVCVYKKECKKKMKKKTVKHKKLKKAKHL